MTGFDVELFISTYTELLCGVLTNKKKIRDDKLNVALIESGNDRRRASADDEDAQRAIGSGPLARGATKKRKR